MESEGKLSSVGTPISEFEIDATLVYRLLRSQHPDLAHLPIRLLDSGWDNVMFRLGDQWSVRLPRREVAGLLILNEQTWLPVIADHLPISVPTPYRLGKPALGYPWRWSVLPWLTGIPADQEEPCSNQAKRFGSFLKSLHKSAPDDAPLNPVRGVPLNQRAAAVEDRMQHLEIRTNLITQNIKDAWNLALSIPIDSPAKWLHGDLHPRNILVENGEITGIIDWGDITSSDIATDLAAIWMLFSTPNAHREALAAYGPISDATLHRAKGWAILFGVILLDTGLIDNPRYAVMGEKILQRVSKNR